MRWLLSGSAAALLASCGGSGDSDTTSSDSGSGSGSGTGSGSGDDSGDGTCVANAEETAGPYPADGSNTVNGMVSNVLTESGVVRSDIRSSFGTASAVASGVPLSIELTVIDLQGGDGGPMAGAAVYLWHCDSVGRYSMYSSGVEGENYLRGVQVADAEGRVGFTSVYPGCYAGRWPHVHFEVYPSVQDAQSSSGRLRTSQLALPQETCEAVYADQRYGDSASNLSQTSLATDMVFADGYSLQMATLTGSPDRGYTATLNVPV